MKITINGKLPPYIKREEIRAIIHSTQAVCAYHNKSRSPQEVKLSLVSATRVLGKNEITGGKSWGRACWSGNWMKVFNGIKEKDAFITVLIHEMLHLCVKHKGGQEMPTSTLTARLHPLIVKLAGTLAKGTYQRSAWFAHCKISYKRTKDNDSYNEDQWNNDDETNGTKL